MNPKNNKTVNIISLILIGILTIIFIIADNIFRIRRIPILNHWLDYVTMTLIILTIVILFVKYLFEEVL